MESRVARYNPKNQSGWPPYPLPAMLRVHYMQLFKYLSDPAMEYALVEIEFMRHPACLKLDRLPDETTILNFLHFLGQHGLGNVLFKVVNKHLYRNGLILREGSMVDAAIFAPRSTENQTGKRDPEIQQTWKGDELHFGVDDTLGLIHSIDTTAGNLHDIMPTDKLTYGAEPRVFGDAGGTFAFESGMSVNTTKASPGSLSNDPAPRKSWIPTSCEPKKIKVSVRAKVEPSSQYIEQVFSYHKIRSRPC